MRRGGLVRFLLQDSIRRGVRRPGHLHAVAETLLPQQAGRIRRKNAAVTDVNGNQSGLIPVGPRLHKPFGFVHICLLTKGAARAVVERSLCFSVAAATENEETGGYAENKLC